MQKNSGQTNNSSLPTEAAALHAAEVIRNFIFYFPPEDAKEALWQLFSTCPQLCWRGQYERPGCLYRPCGMPTTGTPTTTATGNCCRYCSLI